MLVKLLRQLSMILIAVSMFVISVSTWRYQGDIHHLHPKNFESDQNYSVDVYNLLWAMHSQDSQLPIEMRPLPLYELPAKLWHPTITHPSEAIIADMIDDPAWNKFVPNSQSSTYKLFQTFWISRHIGIQEVMNYRLKEIEARAIEHFHKPIKELDINEVSTLLNLNGNNTLQDSR